MDDVLRWHIQWFGHWHLFWLLNAWLAHQSFFSPFLCMFMLMMLYLWVGP
mgnify:CR=1 FL=1